jgi:NTE family protein
VSLSKNPKSAALVLSGGGARGAYQAGVIKAINEICTEKGAEFPFKTLTGVSAGAINASYISTYADDINNGLESLCTLWRDLTPNRVFRTDVAEFTKTGLQWLKGLSLGGLIKTAAPQALLDTSPLRELMTSNLDFDRVRRNLRAGHIDSLAITSTDYVGNVSISFYESRNPIVPWHRARRFGRPTELNVNHVMASSAIPIFFPAIYLEESYFGDGCVRNNAPASPAIHLGAEKLMVIGVRRMSAADNEIRNRPLSPSLARILSVLLNAVFLDAVDIDMERMNRINATLKHVPPGSKEVLLKPLDLFCIQPSQDLGLLAKEHASHLPRVLRYALKGMGTVDEASEIISYLLFESTYCSKLVDLGHEDAWSRKQEIEAFLEL